MAKFPRRHNSGNGQDGSSTYLKIKDGESVKGILAGDIHSFWQTGFGQTSQLVEAGQGKERFRHNFVVKEDGKYVAKIYEFGPKVYDMLSALEESGWDLKNTLLTIARSGSTKENTKYTVTPDKKEPSAATMKEIEGLSLNDLKHKEPSANGNALRSYSPSVDGEVPF